MKSESKRMKERKTRKHRGAAGHSVLGQWVSSSSPGLVLRLEYRHKEQRKPVNENKY